ncbi:hypothetical protein [Legionella tucsonensis]|uniref:Uncharacterized protein n=1 Tax=Legionella tucsonensis TaxID=40335 RepID=A0A0W0ZZH8_9GAMM|nr:hypothetical protein [Legionella tucsonensis]KTD74211.1 hypothetical protein Ltuc_2058 [Legionella tucsonensis]
MELFGAIKCGNKGCDIAAMEALLKTPFKSSGLPKKLAGLPCSSKANQGTPYISV